MTRAPVIVARDEATEHASAGRPHPWHLFANVVAGGVLGGVLLVRSKLRSARRRYAAVRTSALPIDQTVLPAGSTGGDAAPVELAALGDSGMAGVGVREATDTLPIQLAHRVADALGRPVHVTGYGRSGARTRDVLDGQVPQLRRPVDACVLMAGTNDVIRMTPWPRLARDTAGLLDALTETGAPGPTGATWPAWCAAKASSADRRPRRPRRRGSADAGLAGHATRPRSPTTTTSPSTSTVCCWARR